MQTIKRTIGDFDDLLFLVDLSNYGKTYADIEDIFFSVKDDRKSLDNALFFKSQLTGGISSIDNTTNISVMVNWDYNEYSNFDVSNMNYEAGLFFKFTGDPVADEHVDTIFKIVFIQDFSRA